MSIFKQCFCFGRNATVGDSSSAEAHEIGHGRAHQPVARPAVAEMCAAVGQDLLQLSPLPCTWVHNAYATLAALRSGLGAEQAHLALFSGSSGFAYIMSARARSGSEAQLTLAAAAPAAAMDARSLPPAPQQQEDLQDSGSLFASLNQGHICPGPVLLTCAGESRPIQLDSQLDSGAELSRQGPAALHSAASSADGGVGGIAVHRGDLLALPCTIRGRLAGALLLGWSGPTTAPQLEGVGAAVEAEAESEQHAAAVATTSAPLPYLTHHLRKPHRPDMLHVAASAARLLSSSDLRALQRLSRLVLYGMYANPEQDAYLSQVADVLVPLPRSSTVQQLLGAALVAVRELLRFRTAGLELSPVLVVVHGVGDPAALFALKDPPAVGSGVAGGSGYNRTSSGGGGGSGGGILLGASPSGKGRLSSGIPNRRPPTEVQVRATSCGLAHTLLWDVLRQGQGARCRSPTGRQTAHGPLPDHASTAAPGSAPSPASALASASAHAPPGGALHRAGPGHPQSPFVHPSGQFHNLHPPAPPRPLTAVRVPSASAHSSHPAELLRGGGGGGFMSGPDLSRGCAVHIVPDASTLVLDAASPYSDVQLCGRLALAGGASGGGGAVVQRVGSLVLCVEIAAQQSSELSVALAGLGGSHWGGQATPPLQPPLPSPTTTPPPPPLMVATDADVDADGVATGGQPPGNPHEAQSRPAAARHHLYPSAHSHPPQSNAHRHVLRKSLSASSAPTPSPPAPRLGVYVVSGEVLPAGLLQTVAAELQTVVALVFRSTHLVLRGRLQAEWDSVRAQLLQPQAGVEGSVSSSATAAQPYVTPAPAPGGPTPGSHLEPPELHPGDVPPAHTHMAGSPGPWPASGHGLGGGSRPQARHVLRVSGGSGLGLPAAGAPSQSPLAGGGVDALGQLSGRTASGAAACGVLGSLRRLSDDGGGGSGTVWEAAPSLMEDSMGAVPELEEPMDVVPVPKLLRGQSQPIVNKRPSVVLEALPAPSQMEMMVHSLQLHLHSAAAPMPVPLLMPPVGLGWGSAGGGGSSGSNNQPHLYQHSGSHPAVGTAQDRSALVPAVPHHHSADLQALQLYEALGRGGQGVVLRGSWGGLEAAVKCIAQQASGAKAAAAVAAAVGATTDGEAEKGKRRLLRGAVELAVTSTISHPNIVQVFAVFTDVAVVRVRERRKPQQSRSPALPTSPAPSTVASHLRLVHRDDPLLRTSVQPVPLYSALCLEFCDAGTLLAASRGGAFRSPPPQLPDGGHLMAALPSGPSGMAAAASSSAQDPLSPCSADRATRPALVPLYTSLLEVALALRHMHLRRLVHGDLKPANVLLRGSSRDVRGWTCKLSDFGCARLLSEAEVAAGGGRQASPSGTLVYMAPELLTQGGLQGFQSDVYAFGVMMWELLSGTTPHSRVDPAQLPRMVVRQGLRPAFHPLAPADYVALASQCWARQVTARPSAVQLVERLQVLLERTRSEAEAGRVRRQQLQLLLQPVPVRSHHPAAAAVLDAHRFPYTASKPSAPGLGTMGLGPGVVAPGRHYQAANRLPVRRSVSGSSATHLRPSPMPPGGPTAGAAASRVPRLLPEASPPHVLNLGEPYRPAAPSAAQGGSSTGVQQTQAQVLHHLQPQQQPQQQQTPASSAPNAAGAGVAARDSGIFAIGLPDQLARVSAATPAATPAAAPAAIPAAIAAAMGSDVARVDLFGPSVESAAAAATAALASAAGTDGGLWAGGRPMTLLAAATASLPAHQSPEETAAQMRVRTPAGGGGGSLSGGNSGGGPNGAVAALQREAPQRNSSFYRLATALTSAANLPAVQGPAPAPAPTTEPVVNSEQSGPSLGGSLGSSHSSSQQQQQQRRLHHGKAEAVPFPYGLPGGIHDSLLLDATATRTRTRGSGGMGSGVGSGGAGSGGLMRSLSDGVSAGAAAAAMVPLPMLMLSGGDLTGSGTGSQGGCGGGGTSARNGIKDESGGCGGDAGEGDILEEDFHETDSRGRC